MGRYLFRLPDIGEGVAEAEITAWHVKPGDHIAEDGPLLDVMTDKATVDMTSPVEGTVTAIHGDVGSMAPVGAVLVELDVAGEAPADTKAEPRQDVAQNARAAETPLAPPAATAYGSGPSPPASLNTGTASPSRPPANAPTFMMFAWDCVRSYRRANATFPSATPAR